MWNLGINLGHKCSYLLSMWWILFNSWTQNINSWTSSSSVHEVKTPIPEFLYFDSWTSWNLFYELQICIPQLFQEEYLIFISSLFVIATLKSWNPYSNTWGQLCGLYDLIKIKFVQGQLPHLFCLSEIGNPEQTLLVFDLNIDWYSWAIFLLSMFLGSRLYFCWWMVSMSIDSVITTHSLIHCSTLVPFSRYDKQIQKQYQSNCWQIFWSAMVVPCCSCSCSCC